MQAWARPKLKDPKRGLPAGSQVALAIGLAQLAWLDGVAPRAAVHEAVDLAADAELGFPVHKGLVNALLRRASERSEERRVGKECRSRWVPDDEKKKPEQTRQ